MVNENSLLPYTAEEYIKDLRLWLMATDVPEERQGPTVVLALGGQARMSMDDVQEKFGHKIFSDGGTFGGQYLSGVEVIMKTHLKDFPSNPEATMLRSGIEFFQFAPKPGEKLDQVFRRFDHQLAIANKMAKMDFSIEFQSWMLLSVLRLTPKRWSDILKENGHKMPSTKDELDKVKQALVREKTLESQVFELGRQTGGKQHSSEAFVTGQAEPLPLYMCLGKPTADASTGTYIGEDDPACSRPESSHQEEEKLVDFERQFRVR